jgi:signal transduction histidine kinase
MLRSLSGRFFLLTMIFVMLAEVLLFVPSVARFRESYLLARLERAQIASLALLADDMISPELEQELLTNAGVFNVVLRRDAVRQLMLSSEIPGMISATYDLQSPSFLELIRDATLRFLDTEDRVIRVIGAPLRDAGLLIEITTDTGSLRDAMIAYGVRMLVLSMIISGFTAVLLLASVRVILVKPILHVVTYMKGYARAPEDARNMIRPSARVTELREAEDALASLQSQLTGALRQKERLSQLGEAVAKVSHDLRNILTTAQLFTDRIGTSQDPIVQRMAPKLVQSIARAVSLTESTLAFGKAEEPSPNLRQMALAEVVRDVVDSERLAVVGQSVDFVMQVPDQFVIRADAEQVFRILSNLLRNARQAIVASGRAGVITIAAYEAPADWCIEVSDTGPGMPQTALEYIFQPFQGSARKGGVGLGLAIAVELLKGHGGTLTLQHTGAEGSSFLISLPKGAL